MSTYQTTILFHGGSICSWFSAYFAHHVLHKNGSIQMFPIEPSQPNTFPSSETMKGTDVWLLDVSIPASALKEWTESGARSINYNEDN